VGDPMTQVPPKSLPVLTTTGVDTIEGGELVESLEVTAAPPPLPPQPIKATEAKRPTKMYRQFRI
jgi:hypothetical protein